MSGTRPLHWFALSLALGCGAADEPRPYVTSWPTAGWATSSPESQGMSSDALATLIERLRTDDLGMHELVVVRHGTLLLDATFHPYDGAAAHDLASCTKGLTALALGIALSDHPEHSLATPLLSFFPEVTEATNDALKRTMTLHHVLAMQTGLSCVSTPYEQTLLAMQQASDWTAFTLALPMAEAPGASYRYCSPAAHLLSAAVSRITGSDVADLLQARVLSKLGVAPSLWPRDPQGVAHGWGDARMRAADLAKLGLLLLHRGLWETERLLPAAWIDQMTRTQARTEADVPVGYFFRPIEGGFVLSGRGGQFLYVLPALDLVVVAQGAASPEQEAAYGALATELLLPAVLADHALAEDVAGAARLRESLRRAAEPPAPRAPGMVEPAPNVQRVRFAFEPNALGWQAFSLDSSGAQLELSLELDGSRQKLPIALDGVERVTSGVRWTASVGAEPTRIALAGTWQTPTQFTLSFDTLESIDAGSVSFSFTEGGAEVVFSERTFLHGGLALHARRAE